MRRKASTQTKARQTVETKPIPSCQVSRNAMPHPSPSAVLETRQAHGERERERRGEIALRGERAEKGHEKHLEHHARSDADGEGGKRTERRSLNGEAKRDDAD